MKLELGVISPKDWGLPVTTAPVETVIDEVGVSPAELERRARAATYEWLLRQFDDETGAFYGHYRAPDQYQEPPQTVNLIAPWQLLAAYDRFEDASLLSKAVSAASWFYDNHVVDHPMSVVAGGVRDGVATEEIWTKFSAEEVVICLGIYDRTDDRRWLERALQGGRYLIQARRHDYAPRYSLATGRWLSLGWDSWGRAVEAHLLLWRATEDERWLDEATYWGDYAFGIQAADGSFYLIDGEYFNTDLAPDELRALVMLHEATGRIEFLEAAQEFADWLINKQRADGAWPLAIDLDGNEVMPTVGPGDVPNIGIALLRLHNATGDERYLEAAYRTVRYSLSVQATPDSGQPYIDDEKIRWGFWSWDPYYDHTMSGDQSTHHARGMWFLIDYLQAMARSEAESG